MEAIMRRWLAVLGAVVLAPVVPMPVAAPARADAGIHSYLRKHADSHHIPGLAVAVVQNGRVTQTVTLGSDGNGRKITPQTPFLLGSVSKPFTALAVMQLVE